MTDRPIIFSAPMVRALLDGRKTQTRRVLKPQPVPCLSWGDPPAGTYPSKKGWSRIPYAPGDRLYVQEAWRVGAWRAEYFPRGDGECSADIAVDYLADGFARREWLSGGDPEVMLRLMNQSRADASRDSPVNAGAAAIYQWEPGQSPCRHRNARFMPRWASRLTPIVTDVRVQRLQDISDADAVAEGSTLRANCSGFMWREQGWSMDWSQVGQLSAHATGATRTAKAPLTESDISLPDPQTAFASYFNSLHGPDAWNANPWVVALTFETHRCNIDQTKG